MTQLSPEKSGSTPVPPWLLAIIPLCLIVMIGMGVMVMARRAPAPKVWLPTNALVHVGVAPQFLDSSDDEPGSPPSGHTQRYQALAQAVRESIAYLRSVVGRDPTATSQFGPFSVSHKELAQAYEALAIFLDRDPTPAELTRYCATHFEFFVTAGSEPLVTGYFEAELRGSRTRSSTYFYPLYRTPHDLVSVELSKFLPQGASRGDLPRILRGRLTSSQALVPFFSRREIDHDDALSGRGLETVWVDSEIDAFFLHIQGSGVVTLDDGSRVYLGYANSNGHPYRAIGQRLIEIGALTRESTSMQSIKSYLRDHPDEMREILDFNPSYVFFTERPDGPYGSIGRILTPWRSIATDAELFPKGALALLMSAEAQSPGEPQLNHEPIWQPFSRLVLNQDTGGAIRGPARVDYFMGRGPRAEFAAGVMKQPGRLFFLAPRQTSSNVPAQEH